MSRIITLSLFALLLPLFALAETTTQTVQEQADETVEALDESLYTPFIERYILDELKALRTQMLAQRNELQKQILDREHQSVDRAVTYATDTVTYFFYLVAAASSILVIVGWTSIRDIKERIHTYANDEITKLITEYESRLGAIEKQLLARSRDIKENREELETTREVQSLWLRAQQELNPSSKIRTYDQILSIDSEDIEAITYKADAVLELGEPQWAVNLCQQALEKDEQNAHAFYQLGCAYAQLGNVEESIRCIRASIEQNESYREEVLKEEFLANIRELEEFKELFYQVAAGDLHSEKN
ncbi:TPR end-of-group domain-containing protein [Reinekea marinisedimentorum]|uniref:Uncharacterized protein n=1 Tax=Reinekea marinisedimentorum TaxID=230495 RepID=A0A4R3I4R4_9GAMM|nr:tetratricopeptide repeat protein [Reinekea marinisedimentorum]TCS39755.1 hypothetical protein BCF53_11240 [Reinekea marinisedimentorum]